MNGIKKIASWSKHYLGYIIALLVLFALLQWLYSYLPIFVQYSFKVLGYNEGNLNTTLPKFLTD